MNCGIESMAYTDMLPLNGSYRLLYYASVFQEEIFAIEQAVRMIETVFDYLCRQSSSNQSAGMPSCQIKGRQKPYGLFISYT